MRIAMKFIAVALSGGLVAMGAAVAADGQDESCPLDRVSSISTQLSKTAGRVGRLGRRVSGGGNKAVASFDTPPAPLQSMQSTQRIHTPDAVRRLETIRDRILAAAGDRAPASPPEIEVTASAIYGADVYFDDRLLFSHEMLRMADGDDEIAFVMAHELAHIINGDTRNAMSMNRSLERVQAMQRGIEFAADLASLGITQQEQFGGINADGEEIEKHDTAIRKLTDEFVELSNNVVRPVWVGTQEDAADLLGAELMLKAGYSAVGVDLAMEHMKESRASACRSLVALRDSMDAYGKVIEDLPYEQITNTQQLLSTAGAFKAINKRTEKAFRDALIAAALPSTHRPYEERIEEINAWLEEPTNEALLIMAEDAIPQDGQVTAYRTSSAYRTVQTSIDAALEAKTFLGEGNLAAADSKVGQVSMASSHGRLLKRRLRVSQGRSEDAAQNLALALDSARVSPALPVYDLRAFDLLAAGQYDAVEALAARGASQFGDSAHFLPERINVAAKKQDQNSVVALLARCEAAGRADLRKVCYAASYAPRHDFRTATEELYKLAGCGGTACTGRRVGNRIGQGLRIVGGGLTDVIQPD